MRWRREQGEKLQSLIRKFWEVMELLSVSNVVMVLWVYKYIKTAQAVDVKYAQFTVCQLYLNKAVLKKAVKSSSYKLNKD